MFESRYAVLVRRCTFGVCRLNYNCCSGEFTLGFCFYFQAVPLLCCRLRRGSQSLPKTRSSSLKSFNMEDSAELADSEDDLEDT